jgi:hypothetical protein
MSDELGFSSKIDLWILILLLAVVAASVCGIAVLWWSEVAPGWLIAAPLSLPLAALVVLPLWLLFSLRYFMSGERLRVRCGPFQWFISIADIESVAPTQSPVASPAASLDRLRIDYGRGRTIMISPEPRPEFLRQLEHRRGRRS